MFSNTKNKNSSLKSAHLNRINLAVWFTLLASLASLRLNAQNTFPATGSTGIGTASPNASSILEVKSTTKGMLTPRMTKVQRDAIATPATGLLIYQTNSTPGFYYFTGSAWTALKASNASKSLSNLTGPTKINTELLPDSTGTIDLGSLSKNWKNLYLSGDIFAFGGRAFSILPGISTTVGFNSGSANMTGTNNSFFGNNCGNSITTGSSNSFFGGSAGENNTSGTNNTFVGTFAGSINTSGNSNAFFGGFSGRLSSTASNNSFFGAFSGQDNVSGGNNAFFGKDAGFKNTTAGDNSFFGAFSGDENISGFANAFFGRSAGGANTTANNNSFFGAFAGDANTTGTGNSFFGKDAGGLNSTASDNAFFGASSGDANTTGNHNAFFGSNSGGTNSTANNNSFFGANSGGLNITGTLNAFFGSNTGGSNSTGEQNAFFGANAGSANTTANFNAFFGTNSGDANTTGAANAFFGTAAGADNVTGNNNAFFGTTAGNSNTGSDNSFFGTQAGVLTTSGSENSMFGKEAGANNTNGQGLAAFGFQAGLTRSNSFCTFFGYQSDNVTLSNLSNANAFGHLSRATAANQVRIGNSAIGSIGGFVGFTNLSDGRYKKNVSKNVPGLDFINKLNPVTYTLDMKGLQTFLHENDNLNESAKILNEKAAAEKGKIIYTGFIAQEVEAAARELKYDFSGVDKPDNQESLYGLRYAEFTVPLVKAVQELDVKYSLFHEQYKQLEEENKKLVQRIEKLESLLKSSTGQTVSANVSNAILEQNRPNPFMSQTEIKFLLPSSFHSASLVILAENGKQLRTYNLTGSGSIILERGILSAGSYTYSLIVDGRTTDTRQMIISR